MFLVPAGGIVYVGDTKVGRAATMLENVVRVKVLDQMVEHPEKDRLQLSKSKILGFFFFFVGRSVSCTIQHEQLMSSLQICKEGFGS